MLRPDFARRAGLAARKKKKYAMNACLRDGSYGSTDYWIGVYMHASVHAHTGVQEFLHLVVQVLGGMLCSWPA